jgi:hypothetical protein
MKLSNYLLSFLFHAGLLSLAKSFWGLNINWIQLVSISVVTPFLATLVPLLLALLMALLLFVLDIFTGSKESSVAEVFRKVIDKPSKK